MKSVVISCNEIDPTQNWVITSTRLGQLWPGGKTAGGLIIIVHLIDTTLSIHRENQSATVLITDTQCN